MATEEFDRYLTELRRQLRLTSQENQSIADEVLLHLEQQLADLQAEGVARPEAIQRCLADFGQVDQLAQNLTTANRWQQKRETNLMILVAAICFVGSLLTTYQWIPKAEPMRLTFPTLQQSLKQSEPTLLVHSDDFIQQQLDQRFAATVPQSLPIESFCHQLLALSDIQFQILDDPIQTSVQSGGQTAPAWTLPQVRLRTALEIVLPSLGLTYQVRDGLLVIASPQRLHSFLTPRKYSLLKICSHPISPTNRELLIEVLQKAIEPKSWRNAANPNGYCHIQIFQNRLVVTQHEEGHRQLRRLLHQLATRGSP